MTSKYVLPSALLSRDTVHFGSFSLLSLQFHTQCRAPEHNPPPSPLLRWEQHPEGGTQPHTLLCCVALHSSGLRISDHNLLTQLGVGVGGQCIFISPGVGRSSRQPSLAERRFAAGVCQCRLEGMVTLAVGFSFRGYSAKSTKNFAWHEQSVTPKPWLFSMQMSILVCD